ncbi:MAG: RNA ligase family protein [Chloroflexaceae bacterium]
MTPIHKYPRTRHIAGSGIQSGDAGLDVVPFSRLAGRHLVVEEKMDGANCAVSFTPEGGLLLQSRGHYLAGGPRERQFHLFKAWAGRYQAELGALLGGRYVLYGEWLYAKHTIFYTDLPHYFMEFDIYDRQADQFLSTERRVALLQAAPFVVSVRVLHCGTVPSLAALQTMIGRSAFIADDHQAQLHAACAGHGLDPAQVQRETDPTWLMEGLYIKTEEAGRVTGRYKYIRAGFLQTVFESESHWQERPLLPNRLRAGVTLF